MIRYDPTLVDLTSNFFFLCINVKVYLYFMRGGGSAPVFLRNHIAMRFSRGWGFGAPSGSVHAKETSK